MLQNLPMQDLDTILYPTIEPHRQGMLPVDALHTLYWEECGNPNGIPVVFLHGGPGSGLSPLQRRFFDPERYRIILFEQRGTGRSTPQGEVRDNTTQHLIADIEKLRQHMGVEQWLVFGGSWGSTLALAYGQAHPQRCLGFVLRGIFLCTPAEVQWFLEGIRWFYPAEHAEFVRTIPEPERADLLAAYCQRIFSDDAQVATDAARRWTQYESRCLYLLPKPPGTPKASYLQDAAQGKEKDDALARAEVVTGRLEAHYFRHHAFLEDDQLIRNVDRIRHLPCTIVQGRYDVICPPFSAWRLHQAWPESTLTMIADAGHSGMEPGIAQALVAATRQFAENGRF